MRGKIVLVLATALAASLLPTASHAKPGQVDFKFGTLGIAAADFGGSEGAVDVAKGKKGTYVVVGHGYGTGGAGFADMVVARFKRNGKLDRSFSKNGRVVIDTGATEFARAVGVLPNGRTVIVGQRVDGYFTSSCCSTSIVLARLTKKGKLDRTFGDGGIVQSSPFNQRNGYAWPAGLAVQPDGGVVVGGTAVTSVVAPDLEEYAQSTSSFLLLRYDDAGLPDPTFGTGGMVVLNPDGPKNTMRAIAATDDGSVLATGSSSDGTMDGFVTARFLPTGALDPTFGTGGIVHSDFGGAAVPSAITAGKGGFVVAGYQGSFSGIRWMVARHRADGSPTTSFSKDGLHGISVTAYSPPVGVAQRGKNVYLSGSRLSCTYQCTFGGMVTRLKGNGKVDKRYGTRGFAEIPLRLLGGAGFVLDGKKAVLAAVTLGRRGYDLALARFTG